MKARKRKDQDINNLSAEMRQMEEQYVHTIYTCLLFLRIVRYVRFTTYDFKKMHRRSYYPHNQQIISQATGTSSTGYAASRPVTPSGIEPERNDEQEQSEGGGVYGMQPMKEHGVSEAVTNGYGRANQYQNAPSGHSHAHDTPTTHTGFAS